MSEWIEQITAWLLEATQLSGYGILVITLPLGLAQGIFGVFPFATLVMLHISALGVTQGLFASWIVGTAAGMIVYWLCKSTFTDWISRKWMYKLEKYEKWQRSLERYGVWAVIFLRTIPIMPNNLISFMAAISKLNMRSYAWSNAVGNLSSIWLFGILSASIVFPNMDLRQLIFSYVLFLIVLLTVFFIRQRHMRKSERKGMTT